MVNYNTSKMCFAVSRNSDGFFFWNCGTSNLAERVRSFTYKDDYFGFKRFTVKDEVDLILNSKLTERNQKYNLSQVLSKLQRHYNGELCTWFDKLEFCSLFFPLKKKYTLLFALQCLPVCKPEALCRWIAIPAKVKQKGRVIFLYWEKIKI